MNPWVKHRGWNNTRTLTCHNKWRFLCSTVQNLGKQMQERFAAGRTRDRKTLKPKVRKDEMEQTMTTKMEENDQTTGSR